MHLTRLISFLHSKHITLRPATAASVRTLEQGLGIRFPAAYREFLLTMGHGAGKFMVGSDVYINQDLENFTAYGKELLRENGQDPARLNDAFVFWMHQGYQIAWFYLNEGDDPKVHYFLGVGEPEITFEVFDNLEAYLLWLAGGDFPEPQH